MATKPTDDTVLRGDPVSRTPLKLGRYTLKARLGVGGMAEVYLAEQDGPAQFKKRVVIKRILPSLAQDPSLIEMFLREARVAARLHHTNVVQIFELGEEKNDDGTHEYFIAMEYIDGLTLQRLAGAAWEAGRALPPDVAIRAIADAARGIHAAHTLTDEAGRPLHLVHRDISPDNLMVAKDGVTRVLDFGIAKGELGGPKTRTGNLRGKIPYLSPEQVEGAVLDGRCDQFALGVSLYWLLCGERPFDRATDFHTMAAILKDAPRPPRELNPGIPPALEAVILRLLEKDRAKRYATAAELADVLEELASPGTGAGRKSMLAFIERHAPASAAAGNPLSESGDQTSSTRPLSGASAASLDRALSGEPVVSATGPPGSPRAVSWPLAGAQATSSPPPIVSVALTEPATEVPSELAISPAGTAAPLAPTPQPAAPAPPTPQPAALTPQTGAPAPAGNHPVVELLAPAPRQGNALGLVLAGLVVAVLFGALALGALWLLRPDPGGVDAGVAAAHDAGSGVVVDAGAVAVAADDAGAVAARDAGLVATHDAGTAPAHDAGAAPTIVDAGGAAATVDAGASADAGAVLKPPPPRIKVATVAPRNIEFRTESGQVLGRGGDTLSVVAGTKRVVAVDRKRGVSSTMPLTGATLDYGALPTGTVTIKQAKKIYVWLGSDRLVGSAPLTVVAGSYQMRITGKETPVTRTLTVKPGQEVVIDPVGE
ncbi:MAG: protein kinase [Deltaproteobacteria bacterium]|nr:protein kinase [Deltaproteobacteria bacterium]